jgi:small ligand-binding sensory domain FIST
MLKIYTALTKKIDDPAAAVKEILEQLELSKNKMKNTVGIVHFYHEFVETGTCQAVIDALPFETVGCVSSYVGTCEEYAEVALSVTMITGDYFSFSIGTIENTGQKSRAELVGEVKDVLSGFMKTEKPKVVIPYIPALPNFSGDDLVHTANALPETVTLFGTIAFDMENMADSHYVLGKGEFTTNILVFLALYGNFEPKFHITSSFSFETGINESAVISEADGAVLKSVNGKTAVAYLRERGMVTSDNAVEGSVWALPAILEFSNGTQVVRAFLGVVEGTEYIFASGAMEQGAKISFTYMDAEKTLASADKLLEDIREAKGNGLLLYSCAARAWSLGTNYFAEAKKIINHAEQYRADFGTELKYTVAYSGGEICPVTDKNGKLINVLHNYTLISCAFN